jgi:hypothetical protein
VKSFEKGNPATPVSLRRGTVAGAGPSA